MIRHHWCLLLPIRFKGRRASWVPRSFHFSFGASIATTGTAANTTTTTPTPTLTTNVHILFFSQVPIEPTYSAAGVRSQYLLNRLLLRHKDVVARSTDSNNDISVSTIHIISPSSLPLPDTVAVTAPNHQTPSVGMAPSSMVSSETEPAKPSGWNRSNTSRQQQPSQQLQQKQHNTQSLDSDSSETTTTTISGRGKFQYHSLLPNRTNDAFDLLSRICTTPPPPTTKDKHHPPPDDNIFYIIIYDRYYSEEMYSFHVYNYFQQHNIQQYLFLLDMQDMHSLRYKRQLWVKQQDEERTRRRKIPPHDEIDVATTANDDILQMTIPSDDIIPSIMMNDDSTLLRELASIHRCDLTLVCSTYEYNLLVHHYHMPRSKLCIAPLFGGDFVAETTTTTNMQEPKHPPPSLPLPMMTTTSCESRSNTNNNNDCSFLDRRDYVFVGGMKHDPNVDAIRQLHRLWPRIRQKFIDNKNNNEDGDDSDDECCDDDDNLTSVTTTHHRRRQQQQQQQQQRVPNLYIYGANCSDQFRHEIHNPSGGIFMEGYYPWSIQNVLTNKRVMLSPLRYGAGIKGKHIEAWKCSLPITTTSIGSEGMLYPNTYNCPNFLLVSSSSSSTSSSTTISKTIEMDQQVPKFGGLVANTDTEFIDAAYMLYTNEDVWEASIQSNFSAVRQQLLYELCHDWDRIYQQISDVVRHKIKLNDMINPQQGHILQQPFVVSSFTAADTIQQILRHQTNRSTQYFSKYIELKESTKKLQK